MRLRILVTGLAIVGLVSMSFAQFRNAPPSSDVSDYLRNNSTALGLKAVRGLFDPERMHMSQSVSFGYANMGGQGATQGLYMNRIDYQISRPLSVTTHLGYAFQPGGSMQWNPAVKTGFANGSFVGGADVNWRPTTNSLFRVSVYRNMDPSPYFGFSDYGWGAFDYRPYFDRP